MNFLKNIVNIDAEFITLGQLLKHVNLIDIPGEGTFFIQSTKSDKEEAEQDNSESEA